MMETAKSTQVFTLKTIYAQAIQLASHYRWSICCFLAIFFICSYFIHLLLNSVIGIPTAPLSHYLYRWIVMPIFSQIIIALLIAGTTRGEMLALLQNRATEKYAHFDYFSKIFLVGLLVMYLASLVFIIKDEPSIAAHLHHAWALTLLGLGFYLAIMTCFYFSYMFVFFENQPVLLALKNSWLAVKPIWGRVFIFLFIQNIFFFVSMGLIMLTLSCLTNATLSVGSVVSALILMIISLIFAIRIFPVLICAYFSSYFHLRLLHSTRS